MGTDHDSRRQRRHFTGSSSLRGMVRDKSFLFGIMILGIGRVWATEESAAAEEGDAKADFSVAVMLFASVLFMMMTFYLVNNSDIDIQFAAWKTISAMISIFSAVLTYSAMNGVLEDYFITEAQKGDEWYSFKIHMAFALVWYVFLQLLLAVISGAIGGKMPENASKEEQKEIGEKCLLNVDCFAVLCGHISGFAFIRAFAILQCWQVKEAGSYPVGMAVICVLGTWVSLQALFAMSDKMRAKIALGDDGEEDDFEIIWDEGTEETENDVLGLTMSFLCTQVIRLLIWGKLPNDEGEFEEEGKEEGRRLSEEGTSQVHQGMLLVATGCGVMLTVILLTTFELWPEWPNQYGDKKEEKVLSWKKGAEEEEAAEGEGSEEEEEGEAAWYERVKEQVGVVAAMIFAWSFFFGSQACQSSNEEQKTVNAVILAIILTAISYTLIFIVDKIRDLPGDLIDKGCDQVIDALGLVVGFAWEKCFDAAVEVIVDQEKEAGYNPHLLRITLTVCICLILVPGWRYYILPRQDEVKELSEEEDRKEQAKAAAKEAGPMQLENNLAAPLNSTSDASMQKKLKTLQATAAENSAQASKIARDVEQALQQLNQVKATLQR